MPVVPPSHAAVRFMAGRPKSPRVGTLRLQLRVKPGASKGREGVSSVADDCVELCVAAQARDGEANKAVVRLLSETIGLPRTRLELVQGFKSRDKTVVLRDVAADGGSEYAATILDLLRKASRSI
ncbi:GNAT family acetyltransferase [Purpureocillium lavendulum]|uniref:GNAT family acetyltransferase n=1 Tax=Purpureocillium lavendulum TaxID=1247861 RepID=A0AB34FP26_9HYPO|nr:GNAT family acetyltransferase [Purpureocillium lavendulum]